MNRITRLIDGIYVGPTDPAVYAPGTPQAQASALRRERWAGLLHDVVAFDPETSSSTLLPRPSASWTAPATGQQYAARLAKAITLSYETPLGMQVTDCLILAMNFPGEPATAFLKSLETAREHIVAVSMRLADPEAAPHIVRGRLVHRLLLLQASEGVAVQERIFLLLALAGLVVAGKDSASMETVRGCLTEPVLEWAPLRNHPLAHELLDDFLDLQWPADPARAWKKAIHEVQRRGQGRETTPTPATPTPAPTPREPQPGTSEAETLAQLRKAKGAFVPNLQREPVARLRRRGWKIESVKEARSAGKQVPPDAKGHRLLGG